MGFYQLHKTQKIPATIDQVWDFISLPANLKKITPNAERKNVPWNDNQLQSKPGFRN